MCICLDWLSQPLLRSNKKHVSVESSHCIDLAHPHTCMETDAFQYDDAKEMIILLRGMKIFQQ